MPEIIDPALIATGAVRDPAGARYAVYLDWRLVAYAECGYRLYRRDPAGWITLPPAEAMPEAVERRLCAALGLTYHT